MDAGQVVESISRLEVLDGVAGPAAGAVNKALTGTGKHVLSGAWLGHPLHPLLTDVPIGAWTSAGILDLLPTRAAKRASRALIAAGILAAVPTALAGASDWSDLSGEDRRTGLVHAAANTVALLLYGKSLSARVRGHHVKGKVWSLLGMTAMSAGGYLGGHLSYRRGIGVNRNAFAPEDGTGWTVAGDLASFVDGKPVVRTVDGLDVMIVRRGSAIHAMGNVCSHLGGPLVEGQIDATTVTCPWHASRFRLADGSVECGPATAPQPRVTARVRDGRVEVRLGPPPPAVDGGSAANGDGMRSAAYTAAPHVRSD